MNSTLNKQRLKLSLVLTLLSIFFLSSFSLSAQFVTTWQTTTAGESITIPTISTETYAYTVDWGDGSTPTNETGDATHPYTTTGNHIVSITGLFPQIYFYSSSDPNKEKIISIDKWGNNPWASMAWAFYECINLAGQASDNPNLTNVESMQSMFYGCSSFDQDIGGWVTSNVKNMANLFSLCEIFNQNIGSWDTARVTDMSSMFLLAKEFHQDLPWETGEVKYMRSMFSSAEKFNGNITGWDVEKVQDMEYMFESTDLFDQPIGNWTTTSLTKMNGMFYEAIAFDKNIGNWNITGVTEMKYVFRGASSFNQDFLNWDFSNVTDTDSMFRDCIAFDKDLSNLDVSSVDYMSDMFHGTTIFNGNIDNWDVSSVTSMNLMFTDAVNFNRDISGWITTSLQQTQYMFEGATIFDKDLNGWDVSGVTNMFRMFKDAVAFSKDLNSWDVSSVQSMEQMFDGATNFDGNITTWTTTSLNNMGYMFYGATKFNRNIGGWDTQNVTTMKRTFSGATTFDQNLENWNVEGLTTTGFARGAEDMFEDVKLSVDNYDALLIGWSVQNLNPSVNFSGGLSQYCTAEAERAILDGKWATITDAGKECTADPLDDFVTTWKTDNIGSSNDTSITIPTIGSGYSYQVDWNNDGTFDPTVYTGNATHDYGVGNEGTYTIRIKDDFPRIYFAGNGDKEKILSVDQWGNQQWTSMDKAFEECFNLEILSVSPDAPDLSIVNSMNRMFANCTSLNQDINHWQTGNVQNMNSLFSSATNFDKNLNNWDVSSVNTMSRIFFRASYFNGDISTWDTSSVIYMSQMFYEATAFNNDIGQWHTDSVIEILGMFESATNFNQDISFKSTTGAWNTSSIEIMHSMFKNAIIFDKNIGNWDTSSVTDMRWIFKSATAFNQDISSWNVSLVDNMNYMFRNATAFNNGNTALTWTSGTGTSQVTEMYQMFSGATAFNQDISSWNVSNVKKMSYMFQDASIFDQNLESWDVTGVTEAPGMFEGIALSTENYEKLLIGWAAKNVNTGVVFGGGNSTYCSPASVTAHTTLESSWTITDGGNTGCTPVCTVPTSERDALVALYNSTDGANWTDNTNWNTATPVKDWFGVTVDCATSTVTKLELLSNNLDGASIAGNDIPAKIGDLVNLKILDLENNLLTGNIPTEVGDLTKLTDLDFHNNKLSGNIPTNLNNLTNLEVVFLYTNTLTGEIPNNWKNLNTLRRLFVHGNQLNGSVPDFSSSPAFIHLTIKENAFQFGDFENQFTPYQTLSIFNYNPQAKVDLEETLNLNTGDSHTITTTCNGTQNNYKWFKDNVEITGETNNTLVLINLQTTDAGIYHCEVTSNIVTGLTIERNDVTINVSPTIVDPNDFITTWKTTTANENITIPTKGGGYTYTVNWGDGSSDATIYAGDATHPYTTAEEHTVSISGEFPRIYFNNKAGDNKDKIISIDQWGDQVWASMGGAFAGCSNLTGQASDKPILIGVAIMNTMFADCTNFNQDIGDWDVDFVQEMSFMFLDASAFSKDLNDWKTGEVIKMNGMFEGASSFDGNITDWNTAKVDNMSFMFKDATIFNQNIGGWTVSAVKNMNGMFQNAKAFEPNLNWNTVEVTNMKNMFNGATFFNGNIGNWETGKVTSMARMFQNAKKIDQDLNWDVSSVQKMEAMFAGAEKFRGNIAQWNTSAVDNMSGMFSGATNFDSDISQKTGGIWNTEKVTNMSSMFSNATKFDKNIGNWNTGSVENMARMFSGATKFDQNLKNWDVTGLIPENLQGAFDMFKDVKLSTPNYDALLVGWSAQNLNPDVDFSGGLSQYCTAEDERAILDNKWDTITDAGKECTTMLTCPTISSSTTDLDVLPTITWNKTGATNYRVLVIKKSDNTEVVNETLGDVATYTLITSLEENTIYEITIFPSDGTTETTGCTATEVQTKTTTVGLTCPVISSPTTDVDLLPTITWNSITGATNYRVLIVKKSDNTEIVNASLGDVSTYTLTTSLEENTIYEVTIYSSDGTIETAGCTAIEVKTKATTTSTPICTSLSSPINAATDVAVDATLSWLGASDADGYKITIRTGTTTIIDNEDILNTTTYNAPATDWVAGQQYFVKIVAYNSSGNAIDCEETSFTIVDNTTTITLACPLVSSPTAEEIEVSITPTISWGEVNSATSYRIIITRSSDGTEILNEPSINNTEYTLSTDLEKGADYNVTVHAINSSGESTDCTPITFTTETSTIIVTSSEDIPQFFTPNNDGYHDYWNVKDTNNDIDYVYVIDRFGKMLKQLRPGSQGWDGTYIGKPMNEDDYWYVIVHKSGEQEKGHFSLIRK